MNTTVSPQAETGGYDDIGLDGGFLPDRQEIPAWAVSLVVHLLLLGVFWSMHLSSYKQPELSITSDVQTLDEQSFKFATAQDEMGNDSTANIPTPSKAAAMLVGRDPQKEFDRELSQDNLDFPMPERQPITKPSRDDYTATVQTRGETRDAGGTKGAVDILTREIERSLAERKTLVIWAFDASQSLNARRKQFADRFQNVYRQVNERNKVADKALKTIVVSYGMKTTFLTDEPVDDVSNVVKAVRRIEPDKSGKEYCFTAISDVMKKYRSKLLSYRTASAMRRNVMLVLVTDERGDDYSGKSGKDFTYLDVVIRDLRRLNIKAYCVGNAAVFGREKGYVSFTDSTGYQWTNLAVDQGPETVAPERLQLPFWGARSRRIERLSANYGPYALTRMCTETGGLFLISDHSSGAVKFPADVMRKYVPFYGPIPSYRRQIQANRAKAALLRAAALTVKERVPNPQLAFRADSEVNLRNEIRTAQRPLARLDYRLREMLLVMAAGEKDRAKVKEDRWRASFDLAMGRLLAMRVRAFGYQSVLAEMSRTPLTFKTKGSNQWRLVPSSNWKSYEPQVKKVAKKAIMYLKRVIDEHPNTPWALLAEYELATEMGWEWKEGRMFIASRRNGDNPDRILLAEEERRRRMMRKKKQAMRKPPKL